MDLIFQQVFPTVLQTSCLEGILDTPNTPLKQNHLQKGCSGASRNSSFPFSRGFGRFPMDVGVVVVPRADETPEAEQAPELFVALPAPGDVASLSSTKIRRLAGQFWRFF